MSNYFISLLQSHSKCLTLFANITSSIFCPTPSVASSAIRQANDRGCGRQFHDFVIVTIKREIVTFAIV